MIQLTDLKKGECARVLKLKQGNRGYRQRLLAMGLTPGTQIKLCAQAPLGDPVTIQVRGYQLTLRQKEAQQLILERW